MKTSALLFLFILPFALQAQDYSVDVTLIDGSHITCNEIPPSDCKNEEGKEWLSYDSPFGPGVYQLVNGKPVRGYIKEIKVNDSIYYAQPSFPGSGSMMGGYGNMASSDTKMPPIPDSYNADYMSGMTLVSFFQNNPPPAAKGRAFELYQQMKLASEKLMQEATEATADKKMKFEFEDGSMANCSRLPKGETKTTQSCQLFKCQAPHLGYMYQGDGMSLPLFMPMDKNHSIVGAKSPRRIWSASKTQKPIMDNSFFMDNKDKLSSGFGFGGMMGGGMGHYGSDQEAPSFQDLKQQRKRQTPQFMRDSPQEFSTLSDPMMRSSLEWAENNCDQTQAKDFDNSLMGFRQKLAQADMVQLVEFVDGALSSRLVNRNLLPENACSNGETWYREQAWQESQTNRAPSSSKTIDLETAQRLFVEAKNMDDIAWQYKQDGCYARAHLMARRFEAEGVHVDKVWIKGDLAVPTAGVRWNFHVAPIVYVETNGKVEPMVIDPSLTDRPVTIDQWSEIMKKGTVGSTIKTSFPFPQNAASFEHSAIAISNSNPYLPGEPVSLTEQEKMTESKKTMETYLGYSQ